MEIADTQLNDADRKALSEVAAVLDRHGLKRRFGIRLNHRHFPIGPDEILHETNEANSRVLTVVPKNINELPKAAFASQWYFDESGALIADQYCCDPPQS